MNEPDLHFVKILFEKLSQEEMALLLGADERLNELFADRGLLEYDGYERGRQDFVMFFYGVDADRMAARIFPELKHLPFCDRACVLKRYGASGSREETVGIN